MAQYKIGTVIVTNGSNIITGAGTSWLANVEAGDWFKVDDRAPIYQVASINNDTEIELTVNYAEASGEGLLYCIVTDFTPILSLPFIFEGDIDWPDVYRRAMTLLDNAYGDHASKHEAGGDWEISAEDLLGVLTEDQHVKDDEVLAVAEDKTKKGAANGYAPLDADSKVPTANIGYASAAEVLAGALATKIINPSVLNAELIKNLKPVINASINKLDIFTKSGGAVPDASNIIRVAIPDGNGYIFRSRAAAYLSGTSQFILVDATAYWGAVSGTGKMKLHPYAIWDANGGIVFALSRYSGFRKVPVTVTVGDDDYFLLESGSTYTRAATDFCVCLGDIFANYNTVNNPDWTIYQASDDPELAPQVLWDLKSDYGKMKALAEDNIQGSNIDDYSAVSMVVKQAGLYMTFAKTMGTSGGGAATTISCTIKTGSSIYSNAVENDRQQNQDFYAGASFVPANAHAGPIYLNNGDTIHLGVAVSGASGNRYVFGGFTRLSFHRID